MCMLATLWCIETHTFCKRILMMDSMWGTSVAYAVVVLLGRRGMGSTAGESDGQIQGKQRGKAALHA